MASIAFGHFTGNHFEIGTQQGRTMRNLLLRMIEEIPNYEEVKILKPRYVPSSLFLWMAKRRAMGLLRDDVAQLYPEQAQRMEGIAVGAGVDMATLYFVQSAELSLTVGSSSYYLPACTSMGFSPERTGTRETIIGKNFDYPTNFKPFHLTCKVEPDNRNRTLGCTMAPLPGMIDGMNEHGLTVTYNLAYTTERPQYYAPLSLALQEMLETCTNTEEAVDFITKAKKGGNALLMIADANDNIKTVELTHNHSEIRESRKGQIINTNHYHTPEMQKYEIPKNALFTGKMAETFNFQGVRVHESSEQRLSRAMELIGTEPINEDRIVSILRDHGQRNQPSNFTVCRHGPTVSTNRSVIFYPTRRTINVLYGNPCQSEYTEFKFG